MYTVESRYAWRRLVASTAISTLGGVGMWSITVVMPAVQAEFAVTRADVSFSYTTTMIGFGLGTVGAGYLIDRLGAFLTVMLATLILVGGYVAAAFVPTLWLFSLMQILIGLGAAGLIGGGTLELLGLSAQREADSLPPGTLKQQAQDRASTLTIVALATAGAGAALAASGIVVLAANRGDP